MINSYLWYLKRKVNSKYFLYKNFSRFFAKNFSYICSDTTDIIIEGYPRSANTYSVAYFQLLNPYSNISRHKHDIGHILMGVKKQLPVIVLIREPLDAIVSLVIREGIKPKYAIKYYNIFYSEIQNIKKKIIIADFKDCINDFSQIIVKVNNKYSLSFKYKPQSSKKEFENSIKNEIIKMEKNESGGEIRDSHIALPSSKREILKSVISQTIEEEYSGLLSESWRIYRKYENYDSH